VCEFILLKSHWVLVVMYQFTRRIIGFSMHAGDVDGPALFQMFNTAISTQNVSHYLSSDNDPLFLHHRWQANLRILDILHSAAIHPQKSPAKP
jgi:putative transposase